MSNQKLMDSIRRLSVVERVALIQEIWETVIASGEPVGLTEWQIDEYEARLRRHDEHPEEAIPLSEVKKRFNG